MGLIDEISEKLGHTFSNLDEEMNNIEDIVGNEEMTPMQLKVRIEDYFLTMPRNQDRKTGLGRRTFDKQIQSINNSLEGMLIPKVGGHGKQEAVPRESSTMNTESFC